MDTHNFIALNERYQNRDRIMGALQNKLEDDSVSYDEQRFITFGKLQGHVVVAMVHTERNENIRIISIRKATKHVERYYYATITN